MVFVDSIHHYSVIEVYFRKLNDKVTTLKFPTGREEMLKGYACLYNICVFTWVDRNSISPMSHPLRQNDGMYCFCLFIANLVTTDKF